MNTVKMKPRARKVKRTAYHHGDLRQQLLAVAEEIILERGVDGFTLREAARRAGVSPAAPAHHFKDARGLLTEVAMLGFREFGAALEQADKAGGADPARRLQGQAAAYVNFALKHPARFQLMFRDDKHDDTNEEFKNVAARSYRILEGAIRAASGIPPERELTPEAYGRLLAVWSMVHGFSHLALGSGLRGPGQERSTPEAALKSLLPLMLQFLPSSI